MEKKKKNKSTLRQTQTLSDRFNGSFFNSMSRFAASKRILAKGPCRMPSTRRRTSWVAGAKWPRVFGWKNGRFREKMMNILEFLGLQSFLFRSFLEKSEEFDLYHPVSFKIIDPITQNFSVVGAMWRKHHLGWRNLDTMVNQSILHPVQTLNISQNMLHHPHLLFQKNIDKAKNKNSMTMFPTKLEKKDTLGAWSSCPASGLCPNCSKSSLLCPCSSWKAKWKGDIFQPMDRNLFVLQGLFRALFFQKIPTQSASNEPFKS